MEKENKGIEVLFKDLFDGDPWLDVTILGTLENITAGKAAKKLAPFPNSVWEIVNHLADWRLNVLRRVQGAVITTPGHNYFEPVADTSETAWKETIERLKDSQVLWLDFLQEVDAGTFSTVYPNNNMTYYQHIHGIIQHDAYHLGQIVLLAKHI